jgi:hypothetical protein
VLIELLYTHFILHNDYFEKEDFILELDLKKHSACKRPSLFSSIYAATNPH